MDNWRFVLPRWKLRYVSHTRTYGIILPRGSARDSSASAHRRCIDSATRSWQIAVCYYVQ